MSIHTDFLAGIPPVCPCDALAGGVQFIDKEMLKGRLDPKQAAKNILKIVDTDEYV